MKIKLKISLILLAILWLISACKPINDVLPSSSGDQGAKITIKETYFDKDQAVRDYANQELTVVDIAERNKNGRNALTVTLSVPLDPEANFQEYFNVSKEKKGIVDGAWVLDNSGKTLWFYFIEPEDNYNITVYQGLMAVNGQKLLKTVNKKIITRKLQPSVSFDSEGAFLTAGLSRGIPVISVNVNEVDINFYRVKPKHYQKFLNEISYSNYYWNIDRFTKFGDLAYSGRFDLEAPRNTQIKRNIDVAAIDELQSSGLYFAIMSKAGSYENQQIIWFSITDIGLHARFYEQQIDVYASSLKTGKALTKINISLVNKKGEVLQQALTSPEGLASFSASLKQASLIVAQNKQHFSLIEINKPALDLSDFNIGLRPNKAQELFIYAPRNLYRPNDYIDFNALLRNYDGKLSHNSILTAAIRSPSGSHIKHFKWHGNAQGYFYYHWQIPNSAELGEWWLEVETLNKTKFRYYFQVEEFLPERLKLTLNESKKRLVVSKNKIISLPILGEYLYGAPAANNRLTSRVNISLWRKPVESLPQFEFGHIKQTQFNQYVELPDIQLDKKGTGTIKFKGDWVNKNTLTTPIKVNFINSLYESGGRPVTRSHAVLVWPNEYMLGIRSDFSDKNPKENSRVRFELIKANLQGSKTSAHNLDVKLIREDRRYFWVYSTGQGWHYEWSDKEFVELNKTVDITNEKNAIVEFPVAWGNYRLEVREPNTGLISSVHFYAGTNWYENWQKSQQGSGAARPNKIVMALDKKAYQVGDIIKVNVVPPQAGEGIILVEGDQPLWSKRLHIPAKGITVEIPVQPDWQQHNIYISSVVLQGVQAREKDTSKAITPKRSFGIIYLPLQRDSQHLNIDFNVAEKIEPKQKLPVKLKISNNDTSNKAKKLFVTLAAVDVGILNISNFSTPDPYEAFFGQRRYSVDARDVYANVLEINHAEKARLRFGGDADSELKRGGKAPQSDVQIVSLFSGLVEVNQQGEAEIFLDIPDFNGKLRLMALAFGDNQFGSNEHEITVAAPIVTQISLPRFLAKDDVASIALDITNLSGVNQQLNVQLTSSDQVSFIAKQQDNAHNQTISLVDGEKTTLHYQIKANAIQGQASFTLTVNNSKTKAQNTVGKTVAIMIKRQWSLGLRAPYPAIYKQKQQLLKQDEKLTIDAQFIDDLFIETVEASLSIAPRANINLQSQLKNLLQYPYGCLEQTSSRIYPLVFATPIQQKIFNLNSLSETKRLNMINKGIERLASLQLRNGGFGLWSKQGAEEYWLTAYVGDFLINAREMGIEIPEVMLTATLQRLQRYIARSGYFYNEAWSDDAKHYNFAYKAYAAYVLSQVNQAPLSALRNLANNQSKHARTGLAQLHLAIALKNMGDKKRSADLLEQALKHTARPQGLYLADYGSSIRDLALMIHLMLKHNIATEEAITLSFTLAKQTYQQQWFSTQERNALFLAGMSLQKFSATIWSANILLNTSTNKATQLVSIEQSRSYQQSITAEQIVEGITISSTNKQPLLANINLVAYSKFAPKASSNGLFIKRHWLNLAGEEINPSQVNVGDLVLVHLQITAKQRTPDALVTDLLPAGFELENQNLEHSIKLDQVMVAGKTLDYWQNNTLIKHQEYRNDRYVAAVEISPYSSTHLFYLLRAVTPGSFSIPAPLVEDMYRSQLRGVGDNHINPNSNTISIAQ